MITLKGKLEFISFWNPIKLVSENGELDLRKDYFRVFENLNDKKASMSGGMNNLKVFADETADKLMNFEKNDKEDSILMILKSEGKGWGMSNLGAYVPDMLQRLNGMQVIVEFDDESISIKHDESEKVFELNYTHNNSCKIPDDKVKEICKPGQEGCCIFLTVGGGGFECQKFDSCMSRMLLDRYSEKTMRASRIGNCKIVGRIEETVTAKAEVEWGDELEDDD